MSTIRSLCSGYGGLDLAVQHVTGAVVVDHAETDVHAAKVLDRHWPGLENLGDVTAVDWSGLEPTDIITAGFPCQPVSQAGKRKASDDKRWLWPHIGDAVRVLRPRLVVLENVSGLFSPWRDGRWWRPAPVEQVLGDLVALRYDACWRSVRAADVGAPHRRERVFIVAADSDHVGLDRAGIHGPREWWGAEPADRDHVPADPDRERLAHGTEPDREAQEPRLAPPRRGDVDRRDRAVADAPGSGKPHEQDGRDPTGQPVGALDRAGGRDRRGDVAAGVQGLERAAGVLAWGPYAPAIERWERLTRPAPPARDDRGRLNPRFVEWMMGLPDGWVTDIGLTRTAELRMLGNGVVPQQAAYALTSILRRLAVAA